MMCSGAMVFLDSFSHISFASDESRWINSAAGHDVNINATEVLKFLVYLHSTQSPDPACPSRM